MTIKVDLLPTEKKRFSIDSVWIVLVLAAVLCTLVFCAYSRSLTAAIQSGEDDVHRVDADISALKDKLPNLARIKAENEKLAQQIKFVNNLKSDPIRYANLMWEISNLLPDNLWVTSINIEPGTQTVSMQGTSLDYRGKDALKSIAQTMQAFQNSRYFKDALLSSTTMGTYDGVTSFSFSFECHYDAEAALKPPDTSHSNAGRLGAMFAPESGRE